MNTATEAEKAMQDACDAYNKEWRKQGEPRTGEQWNAISADDRANLDALRLTHSNARDAWHRARAAAGDTQSAMLVAIGAA